jgi:hypothetical protein
MLGAEVQERTDCGAVERLQETRVTRCHAVRGERDGEKGQERDKARNRGPAKADTHHGDEVILRDCTEFPGGTPMPRSMKSFDKGSRITSAPCEADTPLPPASGGQAGVE